MEFLEANWVWLLLAVGIVLLLFAAGAGCARGRRGAPHREQRADDAVRGRGPEREDAAAVRGPHPELEHAGHEKRHGC